RRRAQRRKRPIMSPLAKILLDDDSSDEDGGVALALDVTAPTGEFKVNEEYARRFEYNKKREELARCKLILPLPHDSDMPP
ncbi:hypothetical protein KEM52_003725, partial [Ascosphaera acerosa]